MAEFVRAQIFGTTFEITSRYWAFFRCHRAFALTHLSAVGTPTFNRLAWEPLALSGNSPLETPNALLTFPCSSAKDQLTGQSVAVKKIMKPFSTPVLSKRTYRELKLLKHLKHENVRPAGLSLPVAVADGLCRSLV